MICLKVQTFLYNMIDYNFIELSEEVILFKLKGGRWEVYDWETSTIYEKFDSALSHVCEDGRTVAELIDELHTLDMTIRGGRGADGVNYFKWEGDGGGDFFDNNKDLPARINTQIKTKTEEEAIRIFKQLHDKSDIEHAITIDAQGFASGYNHGVEGAVRPHRPLRGQTVVHNHPNNTTFSPQDMIFISGSRGKSIVATYQGGYRQISKGTHFNANAFAKAVKNATRRGLRGKDINDAVDKFLTRNQKSFGYVFKHVKD